MEDGLSTEGSLCQLMAFLCPPRFKTKTSKKKKENDRLFPRRNLTGSDSLDTLTQVGLRNKDKLGPESRLVIIQDFVACVDDEVSVKKGAIVHALYRDNDWVYLLCDNDKEGFVPISYTQPTICKQHRIFAEDIGSGQNTGSAKDSGDAHLDETYISYQEASIFHKKDSGKFLVVYDFIAVNDNDIGVECGDIVTVLNMDDTHWFWIIKDCKQEGFIPSSFIVPIVHTDPSGKGV